MMKGISYEALRIEAEEAEFLYREILSEISDEKKKFYSESIKEAGEFLEKAKSEINKRRNFLSSKDFSFFWYYLHKAKQLFFLFSPKNILLPMSEELLARFRSIKDTEWGKKIQSSISFLSNLKNEDPEAERETRWTLRIARKVLDEKNDDIFYRLKSIHLFNSTGTLIFILSLVLWAFVEFSSFFNDTIFNIISIFLLGWCGGIISSLSKKNGKQIPRGFSRGFVIFSFLYRGTLGGASALVLYFLINSGFINLKINSEKREFMIYLISFLGGYGGDLILSKSFSLFKEKLFSEAEETSNKIKRA
ncbi:MAG: hypothetical protein AB1410_09560 [Acidobacteriota bacterium]